MHEVPRPCDAAKKSSTRELAFRSVRAKIENHECARGPNLESASPHAIWKLEIGRGKRTCTRFPAPATLRKKVRLENSLSAVCERKSKITNVREDRTLRAQVHMQFGSSQQC